jgi:hypothetical protein
VPTYYPGTPDPARATALIVKTGDEISSMDLLLEPATVYSVRGHVSLSSSRRNQNGIILALEARSTGIGWNTPSRQSVVDKPDGAFEIQDVLPGSYTLSAFWFDEGRRYQARQSVEITNIVRGQILWDPNLCLEKDPLRVFARSADATFAYVSQFRIAANGAFLLHELPEGLYRITTSGQSQDCYLKSIRYGGMEISADEFNVIRGTQASLEVTISSRGARVQGTVKDASGLPAVGVWVVLVPNDALRSAFHLFKQQSTDQYGRFNIRGIAPGDYKLFSWEQVEQNAWEDQDFLKPFESKGESISLQEGDGKSIDLVAIHSASQEQDKR